MEERIFTLEEARYLLPRLRSVMEDAGQEWRRMKLLNPEIQKLRDKASMDAFSPYGVPYVHSLSHLVYLLQQIKDMGVVVKDVDQGLCDFPYMRHGKVVYLCWRLGEESIGYWHEIETGFAGREPLDETDR
jgi:hypothetical protein